MTNNNRIETYTTVLRVSQSEKKYTLYFYYYGWSIITILLIISIIFGSFVLNHPQVSNTDAKELRTSVYLNVKVIRKDFMLRIGP